MILRQKTRTKCRKNKNNEIQERGKEKKENRLEMERKENKGS